MLNMNKTQHLNISRTSVFSSVIIECITIVPYKDVIYLYIYGH